MNREILFKAKRVDKNEWIEGDLIHGYGDKKGKMYILPTTIFMSKDCHYLAGWEVIPETVSQFINQYDINGDKIFEGDYNEDGLCVKWCSICNGFEFALIDMPTKDICIPCNRCDGNYFYADITDFVVRGNIHDDNNENDKVIPSFDVSQKNKLISYLTSEIDDVKRIIDERAKICNLDEKEKENLYNHDNIPFDDWNDRENHMYDLGKYNELIHVLKEITSGS